MEASPDPRAGRTRDAILAAFRALALERRYDAIRITDLTAAAGIGRATFYEHFRGKDELLLAAMEPILDPMARAALGRPVEAHLRATLDHVWQQRMVGRIILDSTAGRKLQHHLAGMIATGLDDGPAALPAAAIAAAQFAMLRLWLGGTAPCPAQTLAQRMMACARIARP
jgi:AcrR family transcriptional regulator